MNNDPNNTPFGKAILTGLLAGMGATLACFVFEIIYRMITGYGPSEFINVSSIIFIVNLLLLTAGIIFYYFRMLFKKGNLIFILMAALLTVFCIWKAEGFQRFTDRELSREFSQLLSGTLLITGICAMLIPMLFGNKKVNDFII